MGRRGILVAALAGLLLALGSGAAVAYEASYVGRIYPGVRVAGVDVGGLTREAATQQLVAALGAVADQSLPVRSGLPGDTRTWSVSLANLGLRYDVTTTVAAAYAVGRQAGALERLWLQFSAPMAAPPIPAQYILDDARLEGFVDSLARAIDQPVRDAGVRLTGTQLTVTAAQEGHQLDRGDAAAQLRDRVAHLSAAPVTLKVGVTKPVTGNGDIGDAVTQARRWVSTDVALELPTGTVTLTRDQIATLIHLSQPDGRGPVTATLDRAGLRNLLAPLADRVQQAAQDAAFDIRDGALVVVEPGREGRMMDLDAATATVAEAITSGSGVSRVPVQVVRPDLYSLEDVAAVQGQVARLAGTPVTLRAAGKTWMLSPRDLSAFLKLGTAQQGVHRQLTLDVQTDQAASLAQRIADEVDQPAKNARLLWRDGSLQVTAPSVTGRELDQVAAAKALLDAMQTTKRTVDLPVTVLKPAVSGEHPEQLGIKEVVAEGTSNFDGSPPERVLNIKRGAELVNGAVIAPDGTFSFDDTVGDISVANGFAVGLVILDHETKDGVGGGICQVSTTVFRAAFYAGLPILERHDHAYAVPYYTQGGYPEGFDATIYSPVLDLKFKNDTAATILVQTSVDEATHTVKVTLYGTKDGRKVQMTPGPVINKVAHPPDLRKPDASLPAGVVKQVDWAHDGFDTSIERTVIIGGKATKEVFKSHLEPWQAVYLVGTGPKATAKS